MREKPSLFLFNTVTPKDAECLKHWLSCDHITRYLNEDPDIINSITNLLDKVCPPLLSYHFNKCGRFYMISKDDLPIGFIKLVDRAGSGKEYEIVIAVGSEANWGCGYGKSAVKQCLNMVFFEWRAHKICAKIHHQNKRSILLFSNVGFKEARKAQDYVAYEITLADYICACKSGVSSASKE